MYLRFIAANAVTFFDAYIRARQLIYVHQPALVRVKHVSLFAITNLTSQLSTTLLILVVLLSPLDVYGGKLESYTDTENAGFTLSDIKGEPHSLADYRGKIVLVNFWATWCTPCIEEMPELTQLKQRMINQPFEILAIDVGEGKNRVKHFVQRMKFNLPVLLDSSSKVFNAWNVKIMPTSFLLDANGFVRYRVTGNPGWDDEQTLALIDRLINEIEKVDRANP